MEKNLAELSIEDLVDKGIHIDVEYKALERLLKEVKAEIRLRAQTMEMNKFEGTTGHVNISPRTSSSIETLDFIKACEEVGVSAVGIASALSVKIAKAKIVLGESQYEPIMSTVSDPYNTVKFKSK